MKKLSIGTSTSPYSFDMARTLAPVAIQTGLRSEMGLAVAMLPPTEATLRICNHERSAKEDAQKRGRTHLLAGKVPKLRTDRVEGTSQHRFERR